MDTAASQSRRASGKTSKKRYKGAEILIEYLIKEKVPYLFGVCGHGNVGFLDAALHASDRIKTISTHHEQSAGHMADAYYKVRQEPVATYTSCGPGSCNLPVALAAAMGDSSAFLAITGNVPTTQFNKSPFQETGKYYQADFPSVIRPYVKRSFQPTRPEMIPTAMEQAFALMRSGRPGPVNIDVPLDVFVEEAEVEIPDAATPLSQRSPGDEQAQKNALSLLLATDRPVILVGNGVILSEASDELVELAEMLHAPVATSPDAKGAIDERHDLAFGPTGRNGAYAANEATKNADVLLALGCLFDDRASSAWLPGYTFSIPPTKLIQVDIDPAQIARHYRVELGIPADPKAFLRALIERARGKTQGRKEKTEAWLNRLRDCSRLWNEYQSPLANNDASPIRPERVIKALSRVMPPDGILAADVGAHHNWLVQLWEARLPRHFLQSWGFGSMGFATSGILGAQLAAPDKTAVAVVGDGSFLMTPHALATAMEYDIPAVWVVWNNYGYCSIRDIQLAWFSGEHATSFRNERTKEPYNPDFAKLAQSFGVEATRVTQATDLEGALEAAIRAKKPYLVEVVVDREIRPIGTGSWVLPPLRHLEPNFTRVALGK